MSHLNKILKQSLSISVIQLANIVIRFFSVAIFTNYLTPEMFGNFTLTRTIVNLASIYAMFGMDNGLLRQGSLALGRGDTEAFESLKNYTNSLGLILSFILLFVSFIWADFIAIRLFHNPNLADFIRFCSFAIPIQLIGNMTLSTFQVNKQADKGQFLYQIVSPLLLVGLFYILTFILKEKSLAILSILGSYILYYIFLFYQRVKLNIRHSLSLKKDERKALFGISFPMFIAAAMNRTQSWLDTLFLGIWGSAKDVGIYFVGLRIANFITLPPTALNQVFIPFAGRYLGQGKHEELNSLYKTITRLILFSGSLIFGTIYFLKDYIIKMFGKGYESSTDVILIILIGGLVNIGVGATRQLVTIAGGGKINLINSVITMCLMIGLSYLLIPNYGIKGAAVANAITLSALNLITVAELMIIYKLSPFNLNFFLLLLCFVVVFISVYFLHLNSILKFVIFITVSSALSVNFTISRDQLNDLKAKIKERFSRKDINNASE